MRARMTQAGAAGAIVGLVLAAMPSPASARNNPPNETTADANMAATIVGPIATTNPGG